MQDEKVIGCFALALLIGAVVCLIFAARSCNRGYERLDKCQRENPQHCGEVDTITPQGEHAREHKCWRDRPWNCPE